MALLNDLVQSSYLRLQQSLLNGIQRVNGLFILSQHGFEFVNVPIVLLLLESNVDDGFGDVVVHFLKLLCLLDENSEFILEVDFIVILPNLHQYFVF